MTPNVEQLLLIVRAVMIIVGTFLVTTEGHKGVFSAGDWETLTGSALVIAPIIWGLFRHQESQQIKVTAAIEEVKHIKVRNPLLAQDIPSSKVTT